MKSIEYKGRVYTIKDVPKSYLKKYKADPLKTWIKAKIAQHEGYLRNKEARNKRSREDYIKNKEHYASLNKKRYDEKRDDILAYKKEYYDANRDMILKRESIRRDNPDFKKRASEYLKEWRKDNLGYNAPNKKKSKLKYQQSEHGKAKSKAFRESYKERDKELKAIRMSDPEYVANNKAWHKNHCRKPEIMARRRELHKEWSNSHIFRLKRNLRSQVNNALSIYSEKGKVLSSRKYGLDYLKCIQHLERQAEEMGYTMDELRQMKYQIDHKIPVSLYDLNDMDDIKNCFNPINLQWPPQVENIVKGNKIFRDLIITLPIEIYPKSWGGVIPEKQETL